MAKTLLERVGIDALVMGREDSGAYLRILGLGTLFGIDILNRKHEDKARQLIKEALPEKEDLSDEELEEMAMQMENEDIKIHTEVS